MARPSMQPLASSTHTRASLWRPRKLQVRLLIISIPKHIFVLCFNWVNYFYAYVTLYPILILNERYSLADLNQRKLHYEIKPVKKRMENNGNYKI